MITNVNTMQLRDYQSKAIEKIRKSIADGCRSSLLVLPTGAGKTFIFAEIVRLSRIKNKKVLVLVHKRELIKQNKTATTMSSNFERPLTTRTRL